MNAFINIFWVHFINTYYLYHNNVLIKVFTECFSDGIDRGNDLHFLQHAQKFVFVTFTKNKIKMEKVT